VKKLLKTGRRIEYTGGTIKNRKKKWVTSFHCTQ
jgi:hypothetical protein